MARIAVIGAGISGLSAAYCLGTVHDITLFEKEGRLGGHARTREITYDGHEIAVDTGFIVYNEVNYPHLTALFRHLSVETEKSDMSFGLRYGEGGLEFSGTDLFGLFAQPKNLVSPAYLKMLWDITRFFKAAPSVLERADNPTLGEFLDELALGDWFRNRFIIPMGAAIWSCPPHLMMGFPARNFVQFFKNHGLLGATGHHQWRTVSGGSQSYVAKLRAAIRGTIIQGAEIVEVRREGDGVAVTDRDGQVHDFDEVVFACHADHALAMLKDASLFEKEILGAFSFQTNHALLHRETALMPKAKRAWASWVYAAGDGNDQRISLTYWMNNLQNLPRERPLFVSLDADRPIAGKDIFDRHSFEHPIFSREAIAAQGDIDSIQGKNRVWFCGAWLRNGFHEDGIWSAARIAEAKGVVIPWL